MITNKPEESEDEGELCYICTEPIHIYAVSDCDHRTCHSCALRLRALYDTRNCAYCKAEQKTLVFTTDSDKPYASYGPSDTPCIDRRLNIKFESQAMHKHSMDMLMMKCPHCGETADDWNALKLHTRKEHQLHLCDLCVEHKKVFPYEHTLYTVPQLTQHTQEGDMEFNEQDDNGFKGHPYCAFCKKHFFSSDELFIHCRDNHEKCFLCERKGIQHEYYTDYRSLEEHFKSKHHVCMYPQCLEKKFIVFDSALDLKSHQIKHHGESSVGVQRSVQAASRQIDVNFQYPSVQSMRRRNRNEVTPADFPPLLDNPHSKETKKDMKKEKESATKSDRRDNPKKENGATKKERDNGATKKEKENSVTKKEPRIVPGAPSQKGKEKALKKPPGFGGLSQPSTPSVDTSVVAAHSAFLTKVETMLKSKEKLAEFRSLTSAYRKSLLTAEEYVNLVVTLSQNSIDIANKIFVGVENLLDMEEKKQELIRVWRNKHTAMSQFPQLTPKVPKPSITHKPRVLVIKNKNTSNTLNKNPKDPWNKEVRSKSATSSVSSSPQHSRPSSPMNTSTTTNDIRPLKNTPAFPSLPSSSAPKHQAILNMRRTNSAQNRSNAWSDDKSSEDYSPVDSMDKKKKGKKNQILFRVG